MYPRGIGSFGSSTGSWGWRRATGSCTTKNVQLLPPSLAIIKKVKQSALFLPLALALALVASCAKDIQTTEAVRQGILDDLQQRKAQTGVDPALLDVNVSAVSFEKDQARANVSFSPKSAPGSGGMTMSYVLERQGAKWAVKGRQVGAANPHGAQGAPGASGSPEGVPALPPGHPTGTPKQ